MRVGLQRDLPCAQADELASLFRDEGLEVIEQQRVKSGNAVVARLLYWFTDDLAGHALDAGVAFAVHEAVVTFKHRHGNDSVDVDLIEVDVED